LSIRGFQPSLDAVLHVELRHRPQGGDDQLLASTNLSNSVQNVDGGFPGDFDATITAPALTPACGDALVLRITLVQGGSPYTDFNPTLTTP
jgi:hypothetical protein